MATLDEIKQRAASRHTYATEHYTNESGGPTPVEEATLRNTADNQTFSALTSKSFDTVNAAVGIGYKMEQLGIAPDPDFDVSDHWDDLIKTVPTEYMGEFLNVRSATEMAFVQERITKELENKSILGAAGYRGFGAQLIASLVDVDAALMLASGGSLLAPKVGLGLTKLGVGTGSKLYGAATLGAAGAEASALVELANVASRPTSDATDVLAATVGGMAFGGVLGVAAKMGNQKGMVDVPFGGKGEPEDAVNKSITSMQDELTARAGEDTGMYTDSFSAYPHAIEFDLERAGVDATQATPHLIQTATKWMDTYKPHEVVGEGATSAAAERMGSILQKTPIAGDYYAFRNSKSKIANFLGGIALEASQGHGRINRSGSNLSEQYQSTMGSPFMRMFPTAQRVWAKEQGLHITQLLRPSVRDKFGRDFSLYQNSVFLTGDGSHIAKTGSAIHAAGEAADETNRIITEISKGRGGENPVRGWEDIQHKRGYLKQRWVPKSVAEAIKQLDMIHGAKQGKKILIDTLSKEYQKWNKWTPEDSDIWAKAVVRRALAGNRGADTNVYTMLNEEGVQFAVDFLVDSGVSHHRATQMVDSLMNRSADAKDASVTQTRGIVDLSTPLAGTSLQIVDLLDHDVGRLMNEHIRKAAGHAALARHGIQMQDRNLWIDSIDKELEELGEAPMNRNQLNALFDMFGGGTVGEGVHPWARRLNQLTYLALLNGQLFTQSVEFAPVIASVGIRDFVTDFFPPVKEMLQGKHGNLDEISDMLPQVYGEHLLHRPQDMLEEYRQSTEYFEDLGKFLDKGLGTAQVIQGYVSMLYKIKELQQRLALKGTLKHLYRHFNGGEQINPQRLYDMGLGDPAVYARIEKYFTGPTAKVTQDEFGININSNEWHWQDREELGLILNRQTNLVIQKAMKGESSYLYSKTAGSLITALKQWTLTAANKQAVRSGRMADMEAVGLLTYSSALGGVAYAARETLADRTENVTWEKMGRAALGYGSITGPVALGFDPLMIFLGQDDMTISQYDRGGVLNDPVQLNVMNRMIQIPTSTIKLATGTASAKDVYNIQAAPLIGNLPLFTAVWTNMKEDIRARKKEERKAARGSKKDTAKPNTTPPESPPEEKTPIASSVIDALTNVDEAE